MIKYTFNIHIFTHIYIYIYIYIYKQIEKKLKRSDGLIRLYLLVQPVYGKVIIIDFFI